MTRIAVPYEDGNVYEHFGRSVRFLICDACDGTISTNTVRDVDTPGSGSGVASFLARSKVGVVVCSGLGEGARGHLSEYGIRVVTGASGDAVEAVESYLRGELSYDPSLVHEEGGCGH